MESPIRAAYLHELSCLCPHNVAACPLKSGISLLPMVHRRCVLCRESRLGYYFHHTALNGNKLVQLIGLSLMCLMVQSVSISQHFESSHNDLKYRTQMKHIYNLRLLACH